MIHDDFNANIVVSEELNLQKTAKELVVSYQRNRHNLNGYTWPLHGLDEAYTRTQLSALNVMVNGFAYAPSQALVDAVRKQSEHALGVCA